MTQLRRLASCHVCCSCSEAVQCPSLWLEGVDIRHPAAPTVLYPWSNLPQRPIRSSEEEVPVPIENPCRALTSFWQPSRCLGWWSMAGHDSIKVRRDVEPGIGNSRYVWIDLAVCCRYVAVTGCQLILDYACSNINPALPIF